ncbi:amidohydrolase family protein [Frankia sp. CNm7]|uniref:Amidohydrolase family protein n=1 Tax=Frankia nepalensis TaxID=1836974 RepID=A0A937RLN4_9ACTN|nr:amidohydrolase family protein [Frankia nepalensis]MBL7496217.1 amidohydrolase family protein [Frankia nepalensis]MBL7511644.1 amidohydrolase family protein [Frankia nepalensis]MBL7517731.1 amidohydrolase family protein [Frankia nepalensis]MBL7631114.1 amidohydrolase family protein [Frankia nepalensis]
MALPTGVPIIDTMIGFPHPDTSQYDFIRRQLKDEESKAFAFPAQYMFKQVPEDLPGDDPISVTLRKMDEYGIEKGMIGVAGEPAQLALKRFPDRFVPSGNIDDPNDVMGTVRKMVREYEEFGIRAVGAFPSGMFPQVAINDEKMYPVYAKCVELGIPIFCCAGVPGPRLRFEPQRVELIDQVMFDFPDLVFVTRHGCEPWTDLAVKLLLKWPNLYYSTSAFAPKHYPKAIIDFANSRGADKIIYAGYYPMGLSLDRIMADMPNVPFRDHVWPKFLHENARKVLKLDA